MKYLIKYYIFIGKDIVQSLMKVNEVKRMPALIGGFFRRGQFVVVCPDTQTLASSITGSDTGSRLNAAVKFNETWM